jgi:plastocyanin
MGLPQITAAGVAVLLASCPSGSARADGALTLTVHDAAQAPVAGAVVYLQGDSQSRVEQPRRVVVDQRDKAFVPDTTVIQAGTEVEFPNHDAVSHHVYSFAQPNAFEVPLYKGGVHPAVRFDHPGIVTLGCNIHDSMLGYIVVVDTPHFGRTDATGAVTVTSLPPGDYQVWLWTPQLNAARGQRVGAVAVTETAVTQTVTLTQRLRQAPAPGDRSLAWSDY